MKYNNSIPQILPLLGMNIAVIKPGVFILYNNNKQDIFSIIESEDKKNPLTDQKIADILNTTREKVTEERLLNNIPDSRERRKQVILEDIREILKHDINISDRKLTSCLKEMGYIISRFTVAQLKDEIKRTMNFNNKGDENVDKIVENPKNTDFSIQNSYLFNELIGWDGSLKLQINQAKAAILYPPHGLHTLLVGPSGVGKSYMAEAMYNFAVESGTFSKDAPFIIFNCADYADNPQLLLSQLFGHVKGAFTGADSSKEGLVEKANNGILFLDEVHRLPNEGQEILFSLLDKGSYRRLGETENLRRAKVMIIAATTENPESSLLITFRRRIPMFIEMPSIEERPIMERYYIIKEFFLKEMHRLQKKIVVEADAIKALMFYDCPGNIGQIRSDIQVACARGFLNCMANKKREVLITISDMPNYVKDGILKVDKRGPEINSILNKNLIINEDKTSNLDIRNDRYVMTENIYQFIENRYRELENKEFSRDEIDNIVGNELEDELKNFAKNINQNTIISKEELREIVGTQIMKTTEEAISVAKSEKLHIKNNLYYSLAIHLSSTYERIMNKKVIKNPHLENIIKNNPKEFSIAKKMSYVINKRLNIDIPEDEVAFIAMYLKTFSNEEILDEGKVGVIVITHGHVACGMVEVANKLLGVNHAIGIEMSLNESPKTVLDKSIELVKKIDEGRGCLILVDMGSLVTFGEIITEKTGIQTRVVGRVDTVMVLEALRRAIILNNNLDDVANNLDEDRKYVAKVNGVSNRKKLSKAIVTMCITGQGTALKIKTYIEELLSEYKHNISIIPIGYIENDNVENQLKDISNNYEIIALIGTVNPNIENLQFISVEEVLNKEGLIKIKKLIEQNEAVYSPIREILDEKLILMNFKGSLKNQVIDSLASLLRKNGYVSEGFLLSVYKREVFGGTLLNQNIAIPHGDSIYTTKPAIAICIPEKPIEWEGGNKAEIIFMMALNEDSKRYIDEFYRITRDSQVIKKIKYSNTSGEIIDLLSLVK
jgi:transcriptional regulator with AAA-type ATPase domain/transcriptional regulatory protein LevR